MGLNFYSYDGLQPKMSAGIINEHECTMEEQKVQGNLALLQVYSACSTLGTDIPKGCPPLDFINQKGITSMFRKMDE